jgi:hypothetical protein
MKNLWKQSGFGRRKKDIADPFSGYEATDTTRYLKFHDVWSSLPVRMSTRSGLMWGGGVRGEERRRVRFGSHFSTVGTCH